MVKDGLLVRQRHRKSGDSKRLKRAKKVRQIAHEKWQENGIHAAFLESRVLHHRRKRMPDGIANHSVDASLA